MIISRTSLDVQCVWGWMRGIGDRASCSTHRAQGMVRSWTWWMLSDLLLKPPVKQVSPAVTSPSAYLSLPPEVFAQRFDSNSPLKLVAPPLLLKDRGLLCAFSRPSPRKTSPPFTSSKEINPLVFSLETAPSASLFLFVSSGLY